MRDDRCPSFVNVAGCLFCIVLDVAMPRILVGGSGSLVSYIPVIRMAAEGCVLLRDRVRGVSAGPGFIPDQDAVQLPDSRGPTCIPYPFLYPSLTTGTERRVMVSQLAPQGKKRSPVFRRLSLVIPSVRSRYGVRRIGIFGSFARGEQKRTSDVDVLVEFAEGKATFDNFMQLVYYLEDLFGRKVDLLTVGGIDKYIRPRVEREVIWIEG